MKNISTSNSGLTPAILRRAATLSERIQNQEKALSANKAMLASMLGQTSFTSVPVKTGKRTMSDATRAKIAAGQAKRWAKVHAQVAAPAPAPAAKAPLPLP